VYLHSIVREKLEERSSIVLEWEERGEGEGEPPTFLLRHKAPSQEKQLTAEDERTKESPGRDVS